ncbi:MAG: hypothetical protein Q4C50_02870 [Eubacteriales bacterium]|nr:hypothetical protein [Eubacteriales bacterium]
MSIEVFSVLYFLTKDITGPDKIWKYYIVLLLVQIVAMLPMYTQSFMYGDDLWAFADDYSGTITASMLYSRPYLDLLKGPLLDTSFQSIKYFRIYNSLILFAFGCILFKFTYEQTKQASRALIFSALAISSCFAVDCVAYASIYPINGSLLSSGISFVLYVKSKRAEKKEKIALLIGSMICLLNAFYMYQIGTPFVFVMYMIYEGRQRKSDTKRFCDAFYYVINYAIVAVVYLCSTKLFQKICAIDMGQEARGQFISLDQVGGKIYWFLTEVCPQTAHRLIGILFGNTLFNQNNMFYKVTFKAGAEWMGVLFVSVLVFLGALSVIKTGIRLKSVMYIFIALVAIPLSFWPFLVLPESTYLTYYAIVIIILFLWYVIDGVSILMKKFCLNKKISEGVILTIMIISVLQSNAYAENAWVNYCRDSYEYLADSIAEGLSENPQTEAIVVQGSIGPYVGGHAYVIYCVKDILKEMSYNPENYSIVQYTNANYVDNFRGREVEEMQAILGEDVMEQLKSYYIYDEFYDRWLYNGTATSETDLNFLRECFLKTGHLEEMTENTLFISLEGFNLRKTF